jgi:hypothetical protein
MRKSSVLLNDVLEKIEFLDMDNQAYVSDILSKRLVELKRQKISERAREAEHAYREGKVKKGSGADLLRDLND